MFAATKKLSGSVADAAKAFASEACTREVARSRRLPYASLGLCYRPCSRLEEKPPNQPPEPTGVLGLRFSTARVRSTGPFHSKKAAGAETPVAHLERWAKQEMALPPYETHRDESHASLALTTSVGAIVLGVLAFWLALHVFGMAIVVLGPLIGFVMLVAAAQCFYRLRRSDPKKEGGAIRTTAMVFTTLLVFLGLAAVCFFTMGGSGIYK